MIDRLTLSRAIEDAGIERAKGWAAVSDDLHRMVNRLTMQLCAIWAAAAAAIALFAVLHLWPPGHTP
jgi:hypothetical protein